MIVFRFFMLFWIVLKAWIDALFQRKKGNKVAYAHLAKFSRQLMRVFSVQIDIHQDASIPSDVPVLFVSNHQSELDMLIQAASIQTPFTFISKKENKKMFFVGSWSKSLDVIFFDRDDQSSGIHMLREASRRLKSYNNLLIYPEGTRSKGTKMHAMHAGSLQPAFMAKATIVPIVLKNSYEYKDVLLHKGTFHIHILKGLTYGEYRDLKADGLVEILQSRMQAILDSPS